MKKLFSRISSILILPLIALCLEFILRLTAGMPLFTEGSAGALLMAAAFALSLSIIPCLAGREKLSRVLCLIFAELLVIWFIVAYFTENTFSSFMSPEMMFSQAGNMTRDFGGGFVGVFTAGLPLILLYHVPMLLFIPLWKQLRFDGMRLAGSAAALLLAGCCLFAGFWMSTYTEALESRFMDEYTYDNNVRDFGLMSSLLQEIYRSTLYVESAPAAEFSTTSIPSPAPVETPEPSAAPVEYGKNIMELDFENMNSSHEPAIMALNEYVQSLPASSKNEYTGMFEGKNLILITAEAFTKEIIDPERTPTLYRMATKGIVFEDFYQPAWGGSTSTGEYSWLVGLAPTTAHAMNNFAENDLRFTMGNQLQKLGYYSRAYHNGSFSYYNRHLTHQHLGYSEFIGIGNGLEAGISGGFPASDVEMFDFTIPQYIDKQPFSIYYMTISGHASYAFSTEVNDMAVKHESITADMPYSEAVRAYYACNQELELAMESLLRQLEEAGIADDTVVAIVSDHYPYGLKPGAVWGNVDHVSELYGYKADTNQKRDHSAAIIWCGSLEDEEPIVVSAPSYSLDILPTLSNLFGLEFDSRLLSGRDVLSDAEPLVIWNDHSWLTEKGYFDYASKTFFPAEGEETDESYVEHMRAVVKDKLTYSTTASIVDYFRLLFKNDT